MRHADTHICESGAGTCGVMRAGAGAARVELSTGRCGCGIKTFLCGLLNVDSMHVKVA